MKAADRAQIAEFMAVTGFDVALESMRLSARDAPTMLGLDADDFGLSWSRLADRIFEPEALKNDALEILDNALTEDVFVADAEFVDGMLILSLERIIPEEKKAKEIKVR